MGREEAVVVTDGNPAGHTRGTSERSLRSGLNSVLGFWVQYPDFLCPAGDRFMLVKHYVVAVVGTTQRIWRKEMYKPKKITSEETVFDICTISFNIINGGASLVSQW